MMEKQIKQLGKPEPDDDVINKEPKVLLIGYGWVGQFMGKYFKNAHVYKRTKFYNGKFDGDGAIYTQENLKRKLSGKSFSQEIISVNDFNDRTYEDKERWPSPNEPPAYDLAIIGVPTPMDPKTGQCDTSIVEKMVDKFSRMVDYFLIKSTVEIGTTDRLVKKYKVKIAMSPEYVGETLGHPLIEPRKDLFQIIGGKEETTRKIAEFWRLVLHANAPIFQCTSQEAETIKYCENYWIMQRVDYWNDVYEICNKLGLNFDRVREGLVLDPRLNRTHSFVYPKNRGWSGKCLPKDMNALAYKMRKLKNPLTTLEQQIKKNKEKWRKQ